MTNPTNASQTSERERTHGENCYLWDRHHYECALREIERLRTEVAENDGVIAVWRRRCQDAERELAELRERFENAPVAMLSEGPGGRGYVKAHLSRHATIDPPIGHRVRLVRED